MARNTIDLGGESGDRGPCSRRQAMPVCKETVDAQPFVPSEGVHGSSQPERGQLGEQGREMNSWSGNAGKRNSSFTIQLDD